MDKLKMRLAEIAAPHVYEKIKYRYGNQEWDSWSEADKRVFIQEEADVTGPIIDALSELLLEDSDAGYELRQIVSHD